MKLKLSEASFELVQNETFTNKLRVGVGLSISVTFELPFVERRGRVCIQISDNKSIFTGKRDRTKKCESHILSIIFQCVEYQHLSDRVQLYAVRAIDRVPAGSCHFSCLTDPSQSVVNFPCVRK